MPPTTDINSRVIALEERTDTHKIRLEDFHERIREIEPRVVGPDSLLTQLKERGEKTEQRIGALNEQREAHDRRIDRLETKLAIGFLVIGIAIPVATQALGWVREVYLPTKAEMASSRRGTDVGDSEPSRVPSGIDILAQPSPKRPIE